MLFPRGRNGKPLQCSCLEDSMDRGTWWATIHRVTKSQTQLNMHVVVQLLSCVQLFVTPWTVVHQAPLSMGFSRQEYWSGLPFSLTGDLSDPGLNLHLL